MIEGTASPGAASRFTRNRTAWLITAIALLVVPLAWPFSIYVLLKLYMERTSVVNVYGAASRFVQVPPGGSTASVVARLVAGSKVCPDCAETVLAAARICRFCRHEFPEPPVVPEATDTPEDRLAPSVPPEAAVPAHLRLSPSPPNLLGASLGAALLLGALVLGVAQMNSTQPPKGPDGRPYQFPADAWDSYHYKPSDPGLLSADPATDLSSRWACRYVGERHDGVDFPYLERHLTTAQARDARYFDCQRE
jgi:hypothetical protein